MLDKLIQKIKDKKIINEKMFEGKDIDALLDSRDEEIFDTQWTNVSAKVEGIGFTPEVSEKLQELAKESFLVTNYSLGTQAEISGYISDDFELIWKCFMLEIDEPWLNSLIMSYAKGIFPTGKLTITNVTLTQAIDSLINN